MELDRDIVDVHDPFLIAIWIVVGTFEQVRLSSLRLVTGIVFMMRSLSILFDVV